MTIRVQSRMGDVNHDGSVSLDDFIIIKQNFGRTDATPEMGDCDGDGDGDLDDFILMKDNFGQ